MAEITLAGGVVIDVASGKELSDNTDRVLDVLHRTGTGKPLYQSLAASAVTPSAGATTTVLDLGKPQAGRIWNLVYLSIAGNDDRTVVTGATIASYVGDPDDISPIGLVDPANGTQVPNSSGFSEKQVWVHDTEHLFVVVYGAPTSHNLVAIARVLNYAADDLEAARI